VIRVVVGDLAVVAVDAVLRPADASLAPAGTSAAHLDGLGGASFAAQRRTATPLEAGAAVVTGAGQLAASYVLHVVIVDERKPVHQGAVRRALVSAWQRAGDWGLARLAAPPIGADAGQLTLEEAVALLVETFPHDVEGAPAELQIVVDGETERERVEAIVRRLT
jgi:O-acetyl-ADP-ribose deacetylase (regulator of RNase III)